VVREAALNLMFLSDLAGLDPLPPVCALVTSFEACAEDRAPPADGAAGPGGGRPAAGQPASPVRATPGVLEQRKLRTQELMAALRMEVRLAVLPPPKPRCPRPNLNLSHDVNPDFKIEPVPITMQHPSRNHASSSALHKSGAVLGRASVCTAGAVDAVISGPKNCRACMSCAS
jgi:hypothetical protein